MKRQHQRTLQAIYAHPLRHGLTVREVESLCQALGVEVSRESDHRLRIRMPGGEPTWIRIGEGERHPDLDAEALQRLRHLFSGAGVTPDHLETMPPSPRGDRSIRLVLHLNHQATEILRLVPGPGGDTVDHRQLRAGGVWGSGENLSHRHDRDIAGQRAPRDMAYLGHLTEEIAAADAVLLLGHGQGESDMRQKLLHHLKTQRPDLLDRVVGEATVQASGLSQEGLLAIARRHFGNHPRRRWLVEPGLEPGDAE